MATHTRPLHKRIAFIFDFDGTLGPDTVTELVKARGLAPEEFWKRDVAPLRENGRH